MWEGGYVISKTYYISPFANHLDPKMPPLKRSAARFISAFSVLPLKIDPLDPFVRSLSGEPVGFSIVTLSTAGCFFPSISITSQFHKLPPYSTMLLGVYDRSHSCESGKFLDASKNFPDQQLFKSHKQKTAGQSRRFFVVLSKFETLRL